MTNNPTIYMEVAPNPDGEGFYYLAFIDEDVETLELGSGVADTPAQAMRILTGIVERTLL